MSAYNNYSSAYNTAGGSNRGSSSYSNPAMGSYHPNQGQQQQQQNYSQMDGGGPPAVEGIW
jgi:hypothetical protein